MKLVHTYITDPQSLDIVDRCCARFILRDRHYDTRMARIDYMMQQDTIYQRAKAIYERNNEAISFKQGMTGAYQLFARRCEPSYYKAKAAYSIMTIRSGKAWHRIIKGTEPEYTTCLSKIRQALSMTQHLTTKGD